ncbi:hypothetical protein [Mucilaginibacter sp. KACC 22063]|uniref:hypothetical protein n=1 Tax=Mucilaginibacter sp. KACC 22063 TaxID=3025666 RepID=UPI002366CC5B|nr:hypothetical protein [Mucilaginibacter sp. KACC 22063]WDF54614.1 hypothetical protein PQ461_16905 [Mucilaginibacter sp. KACC 22063]
MSNYLGNILKSHKFLFYSKLGGCLIAGSSFGLFIMKNQIEFYKDQNADLQKKYELIEKTEQKNCENEKSQLKIDIEASMLLQYRKFDKNSKESQLFLETINLLNQKGSK